MKRSKDMKTYINLALVGSVLALAASPAGAVDYYLAAKAFTKTLPMADGTPVDVPMWGYVVDPDVLGDVDGNGDPAGPEGDCWEAANENARLACVNGLADPVVPGPRLKVENAAGNPVDNLRIFLSNGLPEPTSIVITGQELPFSKANNGPTFVRPNGSTRIGSRNNLNLRVRSFGREAAENGGSERYIWSNNQSNPIVKTGSFVYRSGTHPQKQVYMGLYGAVTKDAVAADAVAGTPAVAYNDPADGVTPLASTAYDQEVVLFYSDIDPVINNAIADGTYTTSVDYNAQWFLINGEPFDPANKADPAMTIAAGTAGSPTLVRFFSAASETHVPTLQGLYMDIHAEDGLVYNYQDATGAHAVPRTQYSVNLPPLKTKDAILVPQLEGTYAVYDGNGYMTNPSDINDFDVGDTVGGMLRFLSVAAGTGGNLPPVVADDSAEVVEGRSIAINVLANDSDPEGQPLTINSFTAATAGSVVCDTASAGGTCDYTAAAPGTATFTYDVTDGANVSATSATVTVTVVANDAPVANDDAATTDVNTAVVVNVLANDTDANGDALTIDSFDTTGTIGTVSCNNATGDCTYTPDGVYTGDDTFTYVATDGSLPSASATVTVTVNPAVGNTPPVANNDTYSNGEDTALNVAAPGVLGNDTDVDGNTLTVSQVNGAAANVGVATATTAGGSVTMNADGSFDYTPLGGFLGDDTFTYVANDGTVDGNTATVTITVTPVNDAPVANADTFYLNSMTTTNVGAPGVLANDTDPEGDALTAVLDPLVEQPPELTAFNANGSFAYTLDIEDGRVGTIGTFEYLANDGQTNSTAPGTVTLLRNLSVSQAVCEWEPQQGGRCDWSIQGNKLNAGQVRAYVAGTNTLIGQTGANAGAGAWTITSNNNTQVNPAVGTSIAIDVRVVGDTNAQILGYPTVSQ